MQVLRFSEMVIGDFDWDASAVRLWWRNLIQVLSCDDWDAPALIGWKEVVMFSMNS